MKITRKIKKDVYGVLLSLEEKGKPVARAYIYLLKNSLHKRPFGLLEDVYVDEKYRGQGLGKKITELAVAEAKKRKCYKLIATSRHSKPELQKFYKKFGLEVWGVEYRKDF